IVEAPAPIAHDLIAMKDPNRLVLELHGAELTTDLSQLPLRVQASDPYIAAIRFGTRPPDVLRIVFELKQETRPQLFALLPIAEFGHRIVLDLYPLTPYDPLMAFLESREAAAEAKPPASAPARPLPDTKSAVKPMAPRRKITVAVDPGHGGEDPGA